MEDQDRSMRWKQEQVELRMNKFTIYSRGEQLMKNLQLIWNKQRNMFKAKVVDMGTENKHQQTMKLHSDIKVVEMEMIMEVRC